MPTDTTRGSQRRLGVLGAICIALFVTLFLRLYVLQVIERQTFETQSRSIHLRTLHEQGPRGRILDRNGNVLVDNEVNVVVGIDKGAARSAGLGNGDGGDSPEQVQRRREVFRRLSSILTRLAQPTKIATIETLFSDVRYGPNDFVPIFDNGVSEELKAYLAERHLEFPGIEARARTVRVYPYGNVAAHLLGYVGQIVDTELGSESVRSQGTPANPAGPDAKPYASGDQIGKGGVERTFERYLRGTPGDTVIQVDARGRYVDTVEQPKLRQGDDVWLTIDVNLQALAEQRLAAQITARTGATDCGGVPTCGAKEGSVVVIDPRDGEVRAMASYPAFDPSELVNGVSSELWERLTSTESGKPMLNRAIAESYAPGSTFKLVTTHAALTANLIQPAEIYNDTGVYRLEGCRSGKCEFQNAGRVRLGAVDLRSALTQSSDTYYYRIGDLLWRGRSIFGETAIQDSAKSFGFGQRSGVDLPAESAGLIGTPEWLAEVYAKNRPYATNLGRRGRMLVT